MGLKIVQALLRNESVWQISAQKFPILVVCYTNHALDQFLEGNKCLQTKLFSTGVGDTAGGGALSGASHDPGLHPQHHTVTDRQAYAHDVSATLVAFSSLSSSSPEMQGLLIFPTLGRELSAFVSASQPQGPQSPAVLKDSSHLAIPFCLPHSA